LEKWYGKSKEFIKQEGGLTGFLTKTGELVSNIKIGKMLLVAPLIGVPM
jgi:hypothetical protein